MGQLPLEAQFTHAHRCLAIDQMTPDQCRNFAKQLSASLIMAHEYLKTQMAQSLGIETTPGGPD